MPCSSSRAWWKGRRGGWQLDFYIVISIISTTTLVNFFLLPRQSLLPPLPADWFDLNTGTIFSSTFHCTAYKKFFIENESFCLHCRSTCHHPHFHKCVCTFHSSQISFNEIHRFLSTFEHGIRIGRRGAQEANKRKWAWWILLLKVGWDEWSGKDPNCANGTCRNFASFHCWTYRPLRKQVNMLSSWELRSTSLKNYILQHDSELESGTRKEVMLFKLVETQGHVWTRTIRVICHWVETNPIISLQRT